MQTQPLIPSMYVRIGLALMVVFGCVGMLLISDLLTWYWYVMVPGKFGGGGVFVNSSYVNAPTDILPTVCGVAFLMGGLMVMLARQPLEDEMTSQLRLNALLWAVAANTVLLILALLLFYGLMFFQVMLFNLFTIPIIFTARFYYLLHRLNKSLPAT